MTDTQELEAVCRRLEMATQIARIAVWEWDYQTDALHWSPAVMDILGVEPDDFQGHVSDFLNRLVPEDKERVENALRAHIENRVPYDIEFEMFHTGGRRIAVAGQGQMIWSTDGSPQRMIGTVRDISVTRSLEDRLLQAESMAKIGHWIFLVKENRAIWSPETFRIHGWDPDSAEPDVEKAIGLYHPDDRNPVAENLGKALETGVFEEMDARLVLENGETRHVRIQAVPSFSEDGSPERIFGVLHDRTDLVEKERQLEHAQRLQAFGQLAGGVAHDFNNLMSVILGNLELLQDSAIAHQSENDREMIETSIRAIIRGRDLTQSLLSFARSASLQPEAVVPGELLSEVAGVLRRTIPASLRLTIMESGGTLPVFADRGNLEACLVNLALNARDAIDGPGEIKFTAQDVDLEANSVSRRALGLESGRYVVFEVADNGAGISNEEIERVFEPFFTTKPSGSGSGLGLPRVKGFAEQSGGTVQIESEIGKGTVVRIFLPAHMDDVEKLGTTEGEIGQRGQRLRVLLVEDIEEVRHVVRKLLERRGHEVIDASNAKNAIEAFRTDSHIDVVLSDVVMPGEMQGPELVREIRKSDPAVQVIFMSGYARDITQQEHGINDDDQCLMKPVTQSELDRALASVLGQN